MDEQQIQQVQSQQIDIPQTQESDYQSEPEQLNIPQSDNLEQSEQNNEEEPEISIKNVVDNAFIELNPQLLHQT